MRDQSDYIQAAVHAVQEHLVLGSLLAAAIVFLFLKRFRLTLISAVAIPTSLIATFAAMSYAVEVERKAPSDAASAWVKANADRIAGWLE